MIYSNIYLNINIKAESLTNIEKQIHPEKMQHQHLLENVVSQEIQRDPSV